MNNKNKINLDVIKDLNDEIKENLSDDKIYDLLNLTDASLYEIIHAYTRNNSDDFNSKDKIKNLIIDIFNDEPFIILWRIVDDVKMIEITRAFDNVDAGEDYREYKFKIYQNFTIHELYKVASVDNLRIIKNVNEEIEDVNFVKYQFKNINLFDKTVFLEGQFERIDNISIWDAENIGAVIKFDAYGIDFYVENYDHYMKFIAEWYHEETKEDREIALKCADDYLKSKIRQFSNLYKKLIKGKLTEVSKEIGIFKSIENLILRMKKLEEHRNEIGHGDKLTMNIDFGEVLYDVLTLIFSILRRKNFDDNGWEYLIYNDLND
ncbi:hypothetical protein FDB41_16870 [Clostridium botulinum]|nr:hypothetical protein [Clostridium botulinum]NFO55178.1 hypothetical protein [Clostridium botulinum]